MRNTNEKGVTMVALVVTVVLLLILVTIGSDVGSDSVRYSKYIEFQNELILLQTEVNRLNQNGEFDIGVNLEQKDVLNIPEISAIIYNKNQTEEEKTKIKEGFRYCTSEYLNKKFGLENIRRNYLINVEYRYIVFGEGLNYEGKMYYMIEQIDSSIHNVQYNNKNPNEGNFDVVAIEDNGNWRIEVSNISYYGYIDNWQVKYKRDGEDYWRTSNSLSFNVNEGIYTVKVVHGDEVDLGEQRVSACEFDLEKNVNVPQVSDGMIPIKHDGTNWIVCNEDDDGWYNYDTENKLWANVMLSDGMYKAGSVEAGTVVANNQLGSMFVWIPRYEYKLDSTSETITVKFIPKTQTTVDFDYSYIHPAFEDGSQTGKANGFVNGEWDEEIPGFWVAKYEAGYQASTTDENDASIVLNAEDTVVYSNKSYTSYSDGMTTNALSQDLTNTGYSSEKLSYPVFKSLTYSYNLISSGDSYILAQEIDGKDASGNIQKNAIDYYGLNYNDIDSHLMKNSEWGAVVYLVQSSYGRNQTEVTVNGKNLNNLNSKFIYAITGYNESNPNDVKVSSTGNVTGVFDLNGGLWERTAAYMLDNDSAYLREKYGKSFGTKTDNTKYATIYPHNSTSNTAISNWNMYNNNKTNVYGYGDAILETSTSGDDTTSWYNDYSVYLSKSLPFFCRGGDYSGVEKSGLFAYGTTGGNLWFHIGFRAVLIRQ